MPIAEITPQELKDVIGRKPHPPIIDVRTPVQFREVHLVGAQNVPFDELSPDKLATGQGIEIDSKAFLICKAGVRSRQD